MGATLVLYTWRESRSESLKGILCRNCYVLTDIIATFPLSVDNAERHRWNRWNSHRDKSCASYLFKRPLKNVLCRLTKLICKKHTFSKLLFLVIDCLNCSYNISFKFLLDFLKYIYPSKDVNNFTKIVSFMTILSLFFFYVWFLQNGVVTWLCDLLSVVVVSTLMCLYITFRETTHLDDHRRPLMWKARRVVADVRKLRQYHQDVVMCQKMITSITPNRIRSEMPVTDAPRIRHREKVF